MFAWDPLTGRHTRIIEQTTPGKPGYISPEEIRERDKLRKERGEPLDSPRVGASILDPHPQPPAGMVLIEEAEEE